MSTENLDRYKLLYSMYVQHSVLLHNSNILFLKKPSYDGGLQVRKALRNMIRLQKELYKITRSTFLEHKENVRAAKLAEIENKRKRKKKENKNV